MIAYSDEEGFFEIENKINIRDYFAAKAMQAIISNDNLLVKAVDFYEGIGSELSVAKLAYDQADAMIEARDK